MRSAPLVLSSALLACSACDGAPAPAPSNTLRTDELAMGVSAQGNGVAVLLDVSLASPPSRTGAVEPSPGEPFLASAADAPSRPLAFYSRRWLLLLPTAERSVVLELARPGDTVRETLELPPAFVITPPSAPPSRAMPIPIAWSPPAPGSPVSLTVRGPCIQAVQRQVASDEGAFTFYPGDFAVAAGTGACTFEIEVRRTRTASKTGSLAGTRTLAQVRTVEVTTIP
jgi:hypothetical protein